MAWPGMAVVVSSTLTANSSYSLFPEPGSSGEGVLRRFEGGVSESYSSARISTTAPRASNMKRLLTAASVVCERFRLSDPSSTWSESCRYSRRQHNALADRAANY